MKKIFTHFLKIIFFYILLFGIARFFFILVNKNQVNDFSWINALPSFIHGMRMDLSVIFYFMLPALIITLPYLFFPSNILKKLEYFYHLFILILICLMLPANVILYKYWGSLLNFRALSYLKDFAQIFSSFTFFQGLSTIILLILFIVVAIYLFRRYAFRFLQPVISQWHKKASGFILITVVAVVMMRGGLQKLPMNESLISFSDNDFNNQAAINPVWHLANDIYRAGIFDGNPFEIFPEDDAKKNVKELFACVPDSFPEILTTIKPNIVILILESFTADVVESMGGEKGISPTIDRLIGEGVSFNSIYASGTRTDQGIVSLLNGWPATPYYSIMRSTEKLVKLPSLPILFLEKGYSTSFYYGGESNFSNMNVYCLKQKFQKITDENGFPASIPRGGWGIQDEFVLSHQLNDLNLSKQPFFSVVMTLSNHEPFDVPGIARFPGTSDADQFRNSAAYTDAVIGQFLSQAKEQSWYKNTLFIIAADHGHSLPMHRNVYYPDSHRIPLIFFGDVIKSEFRGAIVKKLGGHHDLAGTLLPQLKMKAASQFMWSKNLLNPTVKPFAYYQIDHLVGWIDPDYWFGYSYNRNKFIARSYNVSQNHLDSMRTDGQSFVQVLYDNYKKY